MLHWLISTVFCGTIFYLVTDPDFNEAVAARLHGPAKPDPTAQALERDVSAHPDNLALREKALRYYATRQFSDRWARLARRQHIYWLIQNRPDSELAAGGFADMDPRSDGSAYRKAKDLWLRQTEAHPKDAHLLANAASFFTLPDKDLAEKLLKQAQRLEPNNPDYDAQLGHLYALDMESVWTVFGLDSFFGNRVQAAQKAAAQYEKAVKLEKPTERMELLPELAKTAFEAQAWEKAKRYAAEATQVKRMPKLADAYGICIHDGNVILGRLALRDGDIAKAKSYLLEAGKTPGACTLDSFGPNMTLANDLLQKGERQAVLKYFDQCAAFWKDEKLSQWKADVQAGRRPDFGANLFY
jgi:hypothetical protein